MRATNRRHHQLSWWSMMYSLTRIHPGSRRVHRRRHACAPNCSSMLHCAPSAASGLPRGATNHVPEAGSPSYFERTWLRQCCAGQLPFALPDSMAVFSIRCGGWRSVRGAPDHITALFVNFHWLRVCRGDHCVVVQRTEWYRAVVSRTVHSFYWSLAEWRSLHFVTTDHRLYRANWGSLL